MRHLRRIKKLFQSKIMHLDEIDGELHILDENLNIIHVFERARSSDANGEVTLSRAAYKHHSRFAP